MTIDPFVAEFTSSSGSSKFFYVKLVPFHYEMGIPRVKQIIFPALRKILIFYTYSFSQIGIIF